MDISKIKEKLDNPEIEFERKKRLRELITSEITSFVILVVGFYLLKYLLSYYELTNLAWVQYLSTIIGMAYLMCVIYFLGNPFWTNKDYKDFLKEKCKHQIHSLFKLRKVKTGFSENDLKESNLFSNFNKIENDDIFNGTFEGITYKVAETNLISKGRKHEFTIFDGLIISLPANKNFKTKTVITTKGDINVTNNIPYLWIMIILWLILSCLPILIFIPLIIHTFKTFELNSSTILSMLGSIGINSLLGLYPLILLAICLILYNKNKDKFEKAKTEDIVFDKRFKIHAQDQVEARYLITTGFMERLNELKLAFGTRNIKCSFFDNKVMIAIQTHRDLFELGSLYKRCPNEKDIKRFYEEMLSIQKLIMHLKLTNKTGL